MPYPFDLIVNADGEMYCSTFYGIFNSTDNGDNWEDVSSGVGAVFVRSMTFADDGTVYAGLDAGMVYRHSSTTAIDESSSTLPAGFTLEQNYPNPFNGGTRIAFSIPEKMSLQLDVYDLQGKLVKTLAKGEFAAGNHFVTAASGDFSSGIYIYRLTTGSGEVISHKMTILK